MGIQLPNGLQAQLAAAEQQQAFAAMAEGWRQAVGIVNGGTYHVRTTDGEHRDATLVEVVLSLGPLGATPIAAKILTSTGVPLLVPWHALVELEGAAR